MHGFFLTYMSALACLIHGSNIIFYDQINPKKISYNSKNRLISVLRYMIYIFKLIVLDSVLITPILSKEKKSLYNRAFFLPFTHPSSDKLISKKSNILRILMIGKYSPEKGHHLLVESLKNLSKENISITLVGEVSNYSHLKYRKHVQSLVIKNNIQKKVQFLDNINYKKMPYIYSNHDLFIFPSIKDPAPYSIIEALSYGLPVICNREVGTSGYVQEGQTGFILDELNPEKIEEKISFFLDSSDALSQFSANAVNFCRKNTSPQSYYSSFKDIINKNFKLKI